MRLLDLFSGIGGFSLGLERAGFQTAAFCEIDPWCRRVLAKHWPGVPCYDDVRTVTADRLRADGIGRIDAICGGFPCQDISLAGKGAGLDGERSGLWREYARLLGELRPRYAIVENVGALRARGLADVLGDLASLGFDAEWHAIPAATVGAPHLRDRVWIVAAAPNADDIGRRRVGSTGRQGPEPAVSTVANTDRDRVRIEPGWRKKERGAGAALSAGDGAARPHSDADGQRCQRQRLAQHGDEQGAPWTEPDGLGEGGRRHGPATADAWSRGSPELRGLFGRLARSLAAASTPWERTAEPPLRRLDDGIYTGLDRGGLKRLRDQEKNALRALGNSVVPQIPELIGRALLEAAP